VATPLNAINGWLLWQLEWIAPTKSRGALLQFAVYVKQRQIEADVGSKYASFRVDGVRE
jgi:hypothetical protein